MLIIFGIWATLTVLATHDVIPIVGRTDTNIFVQTEPCNLLSDTFSHSPVIHDVCPDTNRFKFTFYEFR